MARSYLADAIRAKYPGDYDDWDDEELETAMLKKHPEYKDLSIFTEKENDQKRSDKLAGRTRKEEAFGTIKDIGEKGFTLDTVANLFNEPLSGGAFKRYTEAKEEERSKYYKDSENRVQHTGGQNKFIDALAEFEASVKGFQRGAEGAAGTAIDALTVPSNWTFGIAGKLPKIARLIEATGIYHGGKIAADSDESLINRAFGVLEALGSAAGTFTGSTKPKASVEPEVRPGAKPNPPGARELTQPSLFDAGKDIPAQRDLFENVYDFEKPYAGHPPLESSPYRPERGPQNIVPQGESSLYRPERGPKHGPKDLMDSLDDEIEWIGGQKEQNLKDEIEWIEEQKGGPRETDEGIPLFPDETVDTKTGEIKSLVDQIFPGMQKTEAAPEPVAAGPKPRTTRPKGKFNSLSAIKDFLADEKGEIDLSKLFQGEEDMGYSVRTNDPDTVDLGDISRPIDLEQEALRAGSDTAKPVNKLTGMTADEEFQQPGIADWNRRISSPQGQANIAREQALYDLIGQGKGDTFELQRALKEFGDSAEAARNPNPVQGPELPPQRGKLLKFLSDESGEFNADFYNRAGSQEHSPDLMRADEDMFGGVAGSFAERTPAPDMPAQPSMWDRFKATMADETGAVPRRGKKPDRKYQLVDPNGEIHEVSISQKQIDDIKKVPEYASLEDSQIADALLDIQREDFAARSGVTEIGRAHV